MDESPPLPSVVDWKIFPFEGDMRVRPLLPRLDHERPRAGEQGAGPCICENDARIPVWTNGRWALHHITFDGENAPFPAYMLETVEHMDFGDLSDELAAEFGVLSLRLEHALMSLGTVGRVHINRWGDGGSHCHVWFLGRPSGAWQFSGWSLPLWGFILDGLTDDQVAANSAAVAAELERTFT